MNGRLTFRMPAPQQLYAALHALGEERDPYRIVAGLDSGRDVRVVVHHVNHMGYSGAIVMHERPTRTTSVLEVRVIPDTGEPYRAIAKRLGEKLTRC